MSMLSEIAWQQVLTAGTTLFFVMDPLGNLPIFHTILQDYSPRQKARIITRELIFALLILLAFLLAGARILGFLGLSQSSLNISGGILLFVIAIRMVFPNPVLKSDHVDKDPFIVPLAVPLVAGPSTITVLLLLSSSQPERMLEWTLALFLSWGAGTVILVTSPVILRWLGRRGLRAMERLMGMLLVLIAVQMLLNGLSEYIRNLRLP
jgi:multiple antibiotic resistance protein